MSGSDQGGRRRKRIKRDRPSRGEGVPVIADLGDIIDVYKEKFAVLYRPKEKGRYHCRVTLDQLGALFEDSNDKIKDSFCVENIGDGTELSSPIVFQKRNVQRRDGCWYASLIFQHDARTMQRLKSSLPIHSVNDCVFHSDIIWVFIGKNSSSSLLEGRAEHTDSVTHDGTWHYQCCGEKIWHIRPTELLVDTLRKRNADTNISTNDKHVVKCQPGDILLLNTKLWWHHTKIPCTTTAKDGVSISYARDIYFETNKPDNTELNNMTNVDAVYASKCIKAGDVVLTEEDMPNCELPRSKDPNCTVSTLEDGTGALVALKDIEEGDFFSVAHSSSDEAFSDAFSDVDTVEEEAAE